MLNSTCNAYVGNNVSSGFKLYVHVHGFETEA